MECCRTGPARGLLPHYFGLRGMRGVWRLRWGPLLSFVSQKIERLGVTVCMWGGAAFGAMTVADQLAAWNEGGLSLAPATYRSGDASTVTRTGGRPQAQWLPPEVLGSAGYLDEPRWSKLPQMSVMEFHAGLQERNWTHPRYRRDAPPWKVHFFEDSGRFMRPAFDGYR